jgi:CRP-like cAMP-binding protein
MLSCTKVKLVNKFYFIFEGIVEVVKENTESDKELIGRLLGSNWAYSVSRK